MILASGNRKETLGKVDLKGKDIEEDIDVKSFVKLLYQRVILIELILIIFGLSKYVFVVFLKSYKLYFCSTNILEFTEFENNTVYFG